MIATIWEVWSDRHGDLNKGFDVVVRIILLFVEASLLHFVLHKLLITSALLSIAVFFLLFDYLVTYVLIRNKVIEPRIGGGYSWFTYTGKKGLFDTMEWWKFSPWLRLGIKLAYLIVAVILFIKIN